MTDSPETASTSLSQDSVKARLDAFTEPESGQPLLALVKVLNVVASGGQIGAVLDAGKMDRTRGEALRSAVEADLAKMEGVERATVIMSGHKPAPTMERPKAKATPPKPPTPQKLEGVKHVVAVSSGKGGVGKSTTSVNLALALLKKGLKVGLLDADVFGPSLPTLLAIKEKPKAINGRLQPLVAQGLKVMSIGLMIDPDQPVVWRGPRVMGATQQMLKDVDWGPLDVLVVDMPPGTGDVQLTMVQQAPLSGAVVVSTPQDLALIDARKGLAMFRKVGVPILGIVENMSVFTCPHCGEDSAIFGQGGAKDAAVELDAPFLGDIPLTMELRESSDAGKPIVSHQPDSRSAKAYGPIADQVAVALSLAN